MSDELKLCIVTDENNKEKLNESNEIFKMLNKNANKGQIVKFNSINQTTAQITKIKPDAFVFFTDNIEEFNKYYIKLKKPKCSILITENLHTDFIQESVNLSSEIIYARSELEQIVKRIKEHVLKYQKTT